MVTEIDKYLVFKEKKLGTGFFGSVYQACRKDKPDRELAVK